MTYQTPEIKSFGGLRLQSNSFIVPDGSLEDALNCAMVSDGIITKRRGIYTYFNPVTGVINQMSNFQNKVMLYYEDKVAHLDETGTSPNEVGAETVNALEPGVAYSVTLPRISRNELAGGSVYFTSDDGVKKLTSYNAAVANAGGPIAGSIQAQFAADETPGFLSAGMVVQYRVLFGRRDANGQLILGVPSDIATITNPTLSGTFTSPGAGPWTVNVTTPSPHGLVSGVVVHIEGAVSGGSPSSANGQYQITVTGPTTFSYVVPLAEGNPGNGTIASISYAHAVRVEFEVPRECAAASQGWFWQLYRTFQQPISIGTFGDFRLVTEQPLTDADIALGQVVYIDSLFEDELGVELYTNENSREGELQANFPPPLCEDLTLFKDQMIYGNCTQRPHLIVNLVDTTVLSDELPDEFVVRVLPTTRTYVARTGFGNKTTPTIAVTGASIATKVSPPGYVPDDFRIGDTLLITGIVGGAYPDQIVTVTATDDFSFTFPLVGDTLPVSALYFQGLADPAGDYMFYLSVAESAAVRLTETAQSLVKAINSDPLGVVIAQYSSTTSDIPGQFILYGRNYTGTIELRANTLLAGSAFEPALPDSFTSGTQVTAAPEQQPHVVYVSKPGEFEAVPLPNFFPAGAKNKVIMRVQALRDSVIIIKEDGIFRMTGDTAQNLAITALDNTVFCLARSSVGTINNQVLLLSNQGVCMVSDSSVAIISRTIEDVISPILGRNTLDAETFGVTYESDRLYLLSTLGPNSDVANAVWVYSTLTDSWTNWDTNFVSAVIGPEDTLYLTDLEGTVKKQRKKHKRLDFAGENYNVTVVSATMFGAVITFPAFIVPVIGDIIVLNDAINKIIETPVFVAGTSYRVVFSSQTSLEAGDTPIMYRGYIARVKFAPFHAGLTGRSKHFAQMQLHFRNDVCSRLTIYFSGDSFAGSESVVWKQVISRAGWGLFPWGFEDWGQGTGINLPIGTTPQSICRIYVPRFQARGTFLQAVVEHYEASEQMNIQSLCYAVRAYSERVSR